MKAKEVAIGSTVTKCVSEQGCSLLNCGYEYPEGIVLCNQLQGGDEMIVIEWNDNFEIEVCNVNDLESINGIEC